MTSQVLSKAKSSRAPKDSDRTLFRDPQGLRFEARVVVVVVVCAGAFVVAPFMSSYLLHLITAIVMWALMASSLNLILGYAGQLNLAHGGFMGLGAYTGALGTGYWGWPGLLSMAVAGLLAMGIALLVGLVVFRAKGLFFALLTAGLSLLAYNAMIHWGGAAGMSTGGPLHLGGAAGHLTIGPIALSAGRHYFIASIILLALLLLAVSMIVRSKQGRSWQAIREDQVLAASLGINVTAGKRIAFVAASMVAAVVGVFYAHFAGFIAPESFTFVRASFEPLVMIMIGGAGTIAGPVIGAIIVTGLPEVLRDIEAFAILLYGILVLFVVMLAPQGLVGLGRQVVSWLGSQMSRVAASLVGGGER